MLHNHLRKKYMTKTERIKEFIFGRKEYREEEEEENVSSFANEQRTQSGLSKRKMRKLACLSLIIFLIIGCYAAKMTFHPQTKALLSHDEHLESGRELLSDSVAREDHFETHEQAAAARSPAESPAAAVLTVPSVAEEQPSQQPTTLFEIAEYLMSLPLEVRTPIWLDSIKIRDGKEVSQPSDMAIRLADKSADEFRQIGVHKNEIYWRKRDAGAKSSPVG